MPWRRIAAKANAVMLAEQTMLADYQGRGGHRCHGEQ